MKIDLHVHSKFSDQTPEWVPSKIDCRESYSEPLHIYQTAIRKGMSWVTITDHNSIQGSLAIAHLPNTFISEEVTTYFPDHPGEIHVLTLNIDGEKHRRIQNLRRNIFDLTAYLKDEGIPHVLAHPLYGLGSSFPFDVFERLLLLFRNFEVNGTRAEEQNETLRTILRSLRPAEIERLADRYGIRVPEPEPWLKNLVGGSDDHSLLYVACRYTEVPEASDLDDFFNGLENGTARVGGFPASPEQLAHSVYSIIYQSYRHRLGLRRSGRGGLFSRFTDRSLLGAIEEERESFLSRLARFWPTSIMGGLKNLAYQSAWGLFQKEVLKPLMEEPHLKEILKPGGSGPGDWRHRWLTFVKGVTNRSLFQISNQVFYDAGTAACGILPFLASVARAGTLGLLAGPYIGAFAHAASDRHYSRQVLARLLPSRPDNGGEGSIGCFYDTPQGMLGSLFSSREQLLGCASTDRRCSAVTCHDQDTPQETAVKVFQPVGRFAFAPDPAPPFHMPPFLDLLKYGYESNFTRIHSFTPGPMGLAALGIAHILKLPIRATIHPGLFHFAKSFGDEPSEEAHFWKYVSWYYSRMEQINVPSQWAAGELERRGLPQDKMRVFSRPVDLDRFSPAKRNGYLEKKFPVTRGVYLLYTGWLANERDIFLLREAFTRLRRTSRDVHLICAGEGPMRSELGKGLEGTSVFFTGPLQGEDLALLFASCDLFVSPGTFDLAGDRVLEAQASGLPAVVTDSGCLREHIIPGKTGLVARAGDASSFYQAVEALTLDAPRRQGMGRAARRYMEERNAIADFPENLL